MSLPLSQLQAIRSELDGNAVLYGALSNSEAADELNAADKTQVRSSMTGPEVWNETDPTELAALTPDDRREWVGLCGIDDMNPANGLPAAEAAVRLFGNPSETLTALIAARQETVTRASQIGVGGVTTEDVRLARSL